MAEGIARTYAEMRGRLVEVQSAGTLGIQDRAADPKAVAVCREVGIDIRDHRSQGVTEEHVEWADYILVMEYRHAQHLTDKLGVRPSDRLLMLGTFGSMVEIPDPIGGWKFQFRRCRKDIDLCVQQFVDRLPPAHRES